MEIKNIDKDILEKWKKAGSIAAKALSFGKKLIKPGVKVLDVCKSVDEKILELGGGIAFPTQSSINEVAAHYCPDLNDDLEYKEGDVAKLDVGAHFEGYIGDNAVSVCVGQSDTDLIKASRDALNSAIKTIYDGVSLSEIGAAIQEAITSYGFSPVKNLSGHGLDRWEVHTVPTVPNYDTGDESYLEEGDIIAIEPFASTGSGIVNEQGNPTILMLTRRRNVRSPFAREILKEIDKWNGLPIAKRWLSEKFGEGKTAFALRELRNYEMIKEFPPLVEKFSNSLVSQHEHSIIIGKNKGIILTKED